MKFGTVVNGVYIKNEKEKDKLRKFDAWSLNSSDWEDKPVKSLKVKTDRHVYEMPIEVALKHGFRQEFNGESKLILPMRLWSIDGKEPEKNLPSYTTKGSQPTLF
jgi:hypothetical protein